MFLSVSIAINWWNRIVERRGNGIRSGRSSGWADYPFRLVPVVLCMVPAPGVDLNASPSNHGKRRWLQGAVMLGGCLQTSTTATHKLYIVVLTSSDFVFNDIDHIADGS